MVTITANSYMVFGLRPVTVWLRAVVSADWTHGIIWKLRWLYVKLNNTRIKLLLKDKIYSKYNQRIKLQKKNKITFLTLNPMLWE